MHLVVTPCVVSAMMAGSSGAIKVQEKAFDPAWRDQGIELEGTFDVGHQGN